MKLVIRAKTIINEYTLFSNKLTLFLEKYTVHNKIEKKTEQVGKRYPIYNHPIMIIS